MSRAIFCSAIDNTIHQAVHAIENPCSLFTFLLLLPFPYHALSGVNGSMKLTEVFFFRWILHTRPCYVLVLQKKRPRGSLLASQAKPASCKTKPYPSLIQYRPSLSNRSASIGKPTQIYHISLLDDFLFPDFYNLFRPPVRIHKSRQWGGCIGSVLVALRSSCGCCTLVGRDAFFGR